MSVDYRYFAHAAFDIINRFRWTKISLIFDGNQTLITVYFIVIITTSNS